MFKSGFVNIFGRPNAGKSTLLHCIGSLDRPDAGLVRIGGRDLFAFDGPELARFRSRTLGFVFQFHHLLPEFTALENVMMPGWLARRPDGEVKKDALEAL